MSIISSVITSVVISIVTVFLIDDTRNYRNTKNKLKILMKQSGMLLSDINKYYMKDAEIRYALCEIKNYKKEMFFSNIINKFKFSVKAKRIFKRKFYTKNLDYYSDYIDYKLKVEDLILLFTNMHKIEGEETFFMISNVRRGILELIDVW